MKKEFSFSLFDLDWEVFSVNIAGAVNRVPAIEKTGIKSTVCGPGIYVYVTQRYYSDPVLGCGVLWSSACLSVYSGVSSVSVREHINLKYFYLPNLSHQVNFSPCNLCTVS